MLYVVATPIGNLEDISRRGADVLASVQMIAAEDTRRTRVLLEAIGVSGVPIVALHSHNEAAASEAVMSRLREGAAVALVSDAGTPLLSDPGFELVRACWREAIPLLPVPGPSALAAALSVCPLPAGRFHFEGFLPARAGGREARLRELLALDLAVVFFEAPHRIAATLDDIARLDPTRRLMIGREMTKRHEQYLCDVPAVLRAALAEGEQLKGEFVCVLEGSSAGCHSGRGAADHGDSAGRVAAGAGGAAWSAAPGSPPPQPLRPGDAPEERAGLVRGAAGAPCRWRAVTAQSSLLRGVGQAARGPFRRRGSLRRRNGARKVRAPQDEAPGNAWEARAYGKCNREQTA